MSSKWGGKRKNAGRKKIPEIERSKAYSFYLKADEVEYIESYPGNSRSESLRSLIQELHDLKKRFD